MKDIKIAINNNWKKYNNTRFDKIFNLLSKHLNENNLIK